ncbi:MULTISPECIES: alkaline phosphatase family protein [Amycolatopsis]|uniref:Predicted pyrophosphatase or phosphodiesterase, AlkP superfamily n=2 Tax=Amycolatopsis TaxID=1813 RepID=A0A1I4A428_9PSEU|nr:nucleotide pyrophosphatase/phosphodiesterase family protein [Amycolatopsis sacchari]SFK51073.1 Predicted pyrophosphatase or phosphodiesterase, AlkP superfamily [Amycolatopsis sacchari]
MDLPTAGSTPHLAEVVPSALAVLGVPGFENSLGLPPCSAACVLLVDGLGWELLETHAADAPVLASLPRRPLTVGFPSTTAGGLAAIGTGVQSGEHGLTGYTFEVPGVAVLNALRWREHPGGPDLRERLRPEEVQPLPTTFMRSAAAGVHACVVSDAQFAKSSLTAAVQRGGEYVGVHALGDLAASVQRALAAPGFCYAYHSQLDQLGHLYGPGTPAWRMQLRQVDRLVESIVDDLPPGALLAVVADHGMVAVDATALDLDATPGLMDGVRVVAGEVRARHVYARPGALSDVLATWGAELGEHAWVATREEAIEAGWFGPRVSDRVRPRIGDVVVAARDRFGLLRRRAEPIESALIGQHGSLTPAEQLVPLVVAHRE